MANIISVCEKMNDIRRNLLLITKKEFWTRRKMNVNSHNFNLLAYNTLQKEKQVTVKGNLKKLIYF